MANWDRRYMSLAEHVGDWSKDKSRKVGCVIVGTDNIVRAIGYNGFPRTTDDERDSRHERPTKYLWTEHAERNAIYTAVATGNALSGCRAFLPWFPCPDCARAFVQVGIVELVARKPDLDDATWGEGFKVSLEILHEGRVKVRYLDCD